MPVKQTEILNCCERKRERKLPYYYAPGTLMYLCLEEVPSFQKECDKTEKGSVNINELLKL